MNVFVTARKREKGIVVLSAKKKMPFLSDPKYFRHKGFMLADTAEPYFELLYLPLADDADIPKVQTTGESSED